MLNDKIQRLKKNYEENIISLDIYWNNIALFAETYKNWTQTLHVNYAWIFHFKTLLWQ